MIMSLATLSYYNVANANAILFGNTTSLNVVSGGNTTYATIAYNPSLYPLYTVKLGDTIGGVSAQFGVSSQSIAIANFLTSPYKLFGGELLAIPGGPDNLAIGNKTYDQYDFSYLSVGNQLGVDPMMLKVQAMEESNMVANQIGATECNTNTFGLYDMSPGCYPTYGAINGVPNGTITSTGTTTFVYKCKVSYGCIVQQGNYIISLITNSNYAGWVSSVFNPTYSIYQIATLSWVPSLVQSQQKYLCPNQAQYTLLGLAYYDYGSFGPAFTCTSFAPVQQFVNGALEYYKQFAPQAGWPNPGYY